MDHFVIFSLFFIGFCAISFAAPQDFPWANSFVLPNRNRGLNSQSLGIIGGDYASPHLFPYQVGMHVDYRLETAFCGGSLISANYVLTSAQCVDQAVRIRMIFGAHNISDDSESARQTRTSTDYLIHPGWDIRTLVNDLALIRLDKPVTLNKYVKVVKIAEGDDSYADRKATVTGWGKVYDDNSMSDLLQFATSRILSNAECKAAGPDYASIIQDTHLCFSGNEGGRYDSKGICKGDGGGPLAFSFYETQIGVASFSYRSCEAGKPSVFTRLSKYVDWIRANSDV